MIDKYKYMNPRTQRGGGGGEREREREREREVSWHKKHEYYRKRGSASYIVREVLSVREREREIQRDRERRK